MIAWLAGKKTYIIAIGAIITAVGAYISGTLDLNGLVGAIFAALAAMTLKAGQTRIEDKVIKVDRKI